MQPHEAAVAATVQSRDLVPQVRRRPAVQAEIALAAKLDGRVAHRHADALTHSAAQAPQLGRRERGGADACLRGGADREARRQHWLGAGQLDRFEGGGILPGVAPERRQCLPGVCHAPTVSARRASC
jgi:hypothetical protein